MSRRERLAKEYVEERWSSQIHGYEANWQRRELEDAYLAGFDACSKVKTKEVKRKRVAKEHKHKWKRFAGYAGTDYQCEICGEWKDE